jgi:2-keto-4-pentenoate hydratase
MTRIAEISSKLFEDWFDRAPYETLAGNLAVRDIDEAYAVQSAIQDMFSARRGKIAGRKIALTSKAMQEMCGIDQPVAGAFFTSDVLGSGAKVAMCDFLHLGLEFELALELKDDVHPQAESHSVESVGGLIADARPAFEIIEDKNADYTKLDVFTLIADNAWCGGIVLGPKIKGWEDMDLGDIPSCVHQEGVAPVETNTGEADPLGSLAWVLNHFSARGMILSAGEHIITGSAVRTRFPVAGNKFTYDIAGASVAVEII